MNLFSRWIQEQGMTVSVFCSYNIIIFGREKTVFCASFDVSTIGLGSLVASCVTVSHCATVMAYVRPLPKCN